VEDRRHEPFRWGTNDCLLWAADCVETVTGRDLAAEFRATYNTALGAKRILNSYGGVTGLIGRQLGDVSIHPNLASRGDVVTHVDARGQICAGVCLGHAHAFISEKGMIFIGVDLIERAWRVS